MTEPSRDFVERRWYAVLGTLGLEMVAPIGVGVFLDKQLGTIPWLSMTGVVVGFVGGMWHLVWTLRTINREEAKQPRDRT